MGNLVPAVASSYGGWHPVFVQWLGGAVRAAAESAGSLVQATSMLWRTVGFLFITLQRQKLPCFVRLCPDVGRPVNRTIGQAAIRGARILGSGAGCSCTVGCGRVRISA